MAESLIILGASVRAAARSAIRAGYQPWCADLFADRDLRAIAPVKRCPAKDYPGAFPALLSDAPVAPVLFTGAMENHPAIIEKIAKERPLLGSPASGVRAARDPATLQKIPTFPGLRLCASWVEGQIPVRAGTGRNVVLKPLAGGAGRGVGLWNDSLQSEVPHGYMAQDFIAGDSISALFTACKGNARLLGATEQIIGDHCFGARGFQYAGSLGPLHMTAAQSDVLRHVGRSVAQQCGLRGLFGIDLIRDTQGDLWPIEINPRYPASAEVVEAVTGVSVLDRRFEATEDCVLRDEKLVVGAPPFRAFGKAIVFARGDCTVPDLYRWHSYDQIADVPDSGQRVPAHRPICTLLASANTPDACRLRLHQMAEHLYTRLES